MDEQKLEKIIDRVLEKQDKKYQRYLGVAIEDFDSKLKLIAESTGGIQEQLIAIRQMVSQNTENIGIIKTDMQFIKQGLGQKVDKDEFDVLEKRVMFLEKKLNTA